MANAEFHLAADEAAEKLSLAEARGESGQEGAAIVLWSGSSNEDMEIESFIILTADRIEALIGGLQAELARLRKIQ